jgi:hypothetical protein
VKPGLHAAGEAENRYGIRCGIACKGAHLDENAFVSDIPIEKLLRKSFKSEEWSYLGKHEAFQKLMTKCARTMEGYERLVEIGVLLLRQREDLKRGRPSLN